MKRGFDFASFIGGAIDDAVLGALGMQFGRRRERARPDRRALLSEAIGFYNRPGDWFFPAPPVPRVVMEQRRPDVFDLKWESGFQPHWERVRADYLAHAPNRFAYARMFRHESPAPTLVCLHGYRSGAFFIEERAFPVRYLHRLGWNVVLFQLPFHARRGGAGAPVWPSVNVARTNEGFAQAIFDLRALRAWLDLKQGRLPFALSGMSLGGYTTSLYATVEELAFAAPMIPVASFPDLLWRHGESRPERLSAEREGITLEMLRDAMAVHTPLMRAPRIGPERMLVMSAAGDRIAPPEHASRLARHFGCEDLRFAGGHVLQVGRAAAFRALGARLLKLAQPLRS